MPLQVPAASYRLAVAARYWHAAMHVLEAQIRPIEFMEPVGYLLSMSTELSLKSFLMERRLFYKEIGKKFGHDLEKLALACIKAGLNILERDAVCLLHMKVAHSEHYYRYGPLGASFGNHTILLTDERQSLEMAARLIDTVSGGPEKLRDRHQRPQFEWPETVSYLAPITPGRFDELAKHVHILAERAEKYGAPHREQRP